MVLSPGVTLIFNEHFEQPLNAFEIQRAFDSKAYEKILI